MKFWAVVQYTIKEHLRNRVYLTVFLFGFILIAGGLVVSSLAVDERLRMMTNLGLAGIEFIALFMIVFVTVNLILEEMESKSIYLILSHPLKKWQYVLGRFTGTFISVAVGMLTMALLHLLSLALEGWKGDSFYSLALGCSIAKIAVIGSLALLVSLISTSSASAMTLTAFLWVMGHFSSELRFLGDKSDSAIVKLIVSLFYYVTPDFSLFNYRDFFTAPLPPGPSWLGWLIFYTAAYCGTMLFLSCWLFSKREF